MPTKVLIVDDSRTVLSLLAMGLGQKGYKVYTAESGADAIKLMEKLSMDLVLTDLNMPGMNGLDLLEIIRGSKDTKDLPVVLLSTESDQNDMDLGLKAGADLYLTKPIEMDELDEQLRAVLARKAESCAN